LEDKKLEIVEVYILNEDGTLTRTEMPQEPLKADLESKINELDELKKKFEKERKPN
jgi:DNA-directed RNA polymerase subunit L